MVGRFVVGRVVVGRFVLGRIVVGSRTVVPMALFAMISLVVERKRRRARSMLDRREHRRKRKGHQHKYDAHPGLPDQIPHDPPPGTCRPCS